MAQPTNRAANEADRKNIAVKADLSITGIEPYQVFPRKGDSGPIPFSIETSGPLAVRVVRDSDGKTVAEQKWEVASSDLTQGHAALTIQNVPVGGEYTVHFAQGNQTKIIEHVLVGEIWIIGGQSNAAGIEHEPEPASPFVHYFEGKWREGEGTFFPHFPIPPGKTLLAAWRRAGETYYKLTGVPVGLMGWAFGGVPMSHFWDAEIKEMPDFQKLVGEHGRGATMYMYYQGEMDCEPKLIQVYEDRLRRMATTIRRYADNPDLVMLVCQLGYFNCPPDQVNPYFGRLRETQRRFCLSDPRSALIPAQPYPHVDIVHLNYNGFMALGDRIADCVAEISKTGKVNWQGPRPVRAQFADKSRRSIEITFDSAEEVRVLTKAPGAPPERADTHRPEMDWVVVDDDHRGYAEITSSTIKDGRVTISVIGAAMGPSKSTDNPATLSAVLEKTGYIQPTRVSADGLVVTLELPDAAKPGAKVSYGLLNNSLCTLTDEKGKAAATFDELAVEEPRRAE